MGLPSYLGALSAFNSYGADMIGIPMDDEGEIPEVMEDEIKKAIARGKKPKFIYVIPDFQNPAGMTMSEKRRKEIIDIAHRYDILIVEDSPYRELRYEGENQRTLYELDGTQQVVLLGTFPKYFLSWLPYSVWVMGHPEVLDKVVIGKQLLTLHSFCTQRIAARIWERVF